MSDDSPARQRLLAVAARRLGDGTSPRLTMSGILFVAGAVGFVASAVLLKAGVLNMWVRYPLAVGVGYLGFLGLLWLWLRSARGTGGELGDVAQTAYLLDAVDAHDRRRGRSPGDTSWLGSLFGGGGNDGGGSGSGDNDVVGTIVVAVLVTVLVAAVLFAAVYLIVIAPALLAELLVDAAVVGSIPKKDARHWTRTAFRRTGYLALGLAALLGLVGYGLELAAPGAHSLGQAMGFGAPR